MKRLLILLGWVFLFFTYVNVDALATDFNPSAYHFLLVGRGDSPAINNIGEIVYVSKDGSGNPQVFSSIGGQLTNSNTMNLRIPDINDSREVVYSDFVPGQPLLNVLSTTRGYIAPGNCAGINNSGEISYFLGYGTWDTIYTNQRGAILQTNGWPSATTDINNRGEIVYDDYDSNHKIEVFSTTRGQLTTLGGNRPVINDYGQIVYSKGSLLYALNGPRLFDYPIADGGNLASIPQFDVNDNRDVVFAYPGYLQNYIILATEKPDLYSQFSEIDPSKLPEPSTIFLLGFGLIGLLGMRRKI